MTTKTLICSPMRLVWSSLEERCLLRERPRQPIKWLGKKTNHIWVFFLVTILKTPMCHLALKYSFTKLMRHHFIRLKSPIPSKLSKQRSSERLPMSAEDSGRRRMGRSTWSLSLMTRGRIKLPKSPDFFKITKPTVIDNRIQLVIKLRN